MRGLTSSAESARASRLVRSAVRSAFAALALLIALYEALGLYFQFTNRVPEPAPLVRGFTRIEQAFLAKGPTALRSNLDTLWELRPGSRVESLAINGDGYRGPVVPRGRSSRLRIAVLGTSVSLGLSVDEEKTWPRRLESLYRSRGLDCEVLNFSVPGYTAVQGARQWGSRVAPHRPDWVLLTFAGTHESEPPLTGRGDAARLALARGTRFRIVQFLRSYSTLRALLPASVDIPEKATASAARATPEEYETALAETIRDVNSAGAKCAIILTPVMPSSSSTIVHANYAPAAERAAASGRAKYLPLTFPSGAGERGQGESLFLDRVHLTDAGNRAMAELVARRFDPRALSPK